MSQLTPPTAQPQMEEEMTASAALGPILVIIPTYNESENIARIISRTRSAVPDAHILIADDNSPDGTGKLADEIASTDDHVHVMHRLGKEGLGAAYLAGFEWGLNAGYEVLVEMDADGSHQPEQLSVLLAALADADLVLGSRGSRAARCSTGRSHARPCRAPEICGPDSRSASRYTTRPAVTAPFAARPCSGSGWTTLPPRVTASKLISPGGR